VQHDSFLLLILSAIKLRLASVASALLVVTKKNRPTDQFVAAVMRQIFVRRQPDLNIGQITGC
jgi:hypothetical protein